MIGIDFYRQKKIGTSSTRLSFNSDVSKIPNEVCLETVQCPMGCKISDKLLFSGKDRIHGLPGQFNVVQCNTCGLIRTNPRPTPETIGFYYPDHYGPYLGTYIKDEVGPKSKVSRKVDALLKKHIVFNATVIPNLPPGRLLEIGCASGSFLYKMKKRDWIVQGIELSSSASQNARNHGISVFNGSVECAPEPDHPYDLIVGWMVLEHLHDPAKALNLLNKWSKPDGWLVLSVPNADSMEFNLFRQRWYALHLPAHLFHFTQNTLKELLARCGWETVRVFHQRSINNLIASCGYWMQDRKIFPGIAHWMAGFPEKPAYLHALAYPISLALSAIGQTGRLTLWARKKKK